MKKGGVFKRELRPVVILCAGEGRRLLDLGKFIPKAMVKINNRRPIISFVINYWKDFAKEFIFVVGYKKEQIISYVESEKPSLPVRFIDQERPAGIAHAISCARSYLDGDFIVVLGDCLCQGEFLFPCSFSQGVGVWETTNSNFIKQSYSVEIENNFVNRVVEKPKVIINNLCGMGYYFFQKKVFDYVLKTPPSSLRNEVEITDVIQKMIESQEEVSPIFFKGEYINITSVEDVLRAQNLFKT